jgi:hypothetical protein
LREDRDQLRCHCQFRMHFDVGEIRPHGLIPQHYTIHSSSLSDSEFHLTGRMVFEFH